MNIHVHMGSNYPIQPVLHIRLSGFHNSQGTDICSSFPRVFPLAVSLIFFCICLPVLSQHLDQFPPFADRVAAKHLAFTLMRGRIGHVKQLSDASKYIVTIHFWLLPVASSRFYFAGAC